MSARLTSIPRTCTILHGTLSEVYVMTSLVDAWSAGLIDGDGSIHISRNRGGRWTTYQLRVQLSQSGYSLPPVLTVLQSEYGGSICRVDYPSKMPRWEWILGSADADAFLKRIKPFCVGKAEQIDIALAYRENAVGIGKSNAERDRYYRALRRLKNYTRKG